MTGALSQISQFLFVLQNKVGDLMSKRTTKLTPLEEKEIVNHHHWPLKKFCCSDDWTNCHKCNMTRSRMAVELLDMFGPDSVSSSKYYLLLLKVDLVAKYVMLTSFWNFSWLKASFLVYWSSIIYRIEECKYIKNIFYLTKKHDDYNIFTYYYL